MQPRSNSANIIRRAAWISLGVFLVAYLFVAFYGGIRHNAAARDLFYVPIGAVTVLTLILIAIRSRGTDRAVWTFLAVTGTGWACGDIWLRLKDLSGVAGDPRPLGVPDILYVIAYISLIIAVYRLSLLTGRPGRRGAGFAWHPLFIVVFVGALTALFAIFMPHGLSPFEPGTSVNLPMIIDYLYPALDIVVLLGLLLALFMSVLPWRKSWQEMIMFGLALFMVADLTFSFSMPAGVYEPSNLPSRLVIALWIIGYSLILMAAIYKLTDPETTPASTTRYVDSQTEA